VVASGMCSRLKLILPDTIALDLGISNFVQRQAGRIRSENLQLFFLKRKQNKKLFFKNYETDWASLITAMSFFLV
jgi:hypothetical protein